MYLQAKHICICLEAGSVKQGGCCHPAFRWAAVNKVTHSRSSGILQVMFHIYEDAELKPLLDAVNDEREKEKEKENEG